MNDGLILKYELLKSTHLPYKIFFSSQLFWNQISVFNVVLKNNLFYF